MEPKFKLTIRKLKQDCDHCIAKLIPIKIILSTLYILAKYSLKANLF